MAAWQVGEGLVIMLAALRDIPPELYDAALVDGAGAWARFRTVVLPLIAPTFLLLAFRDTIVSLQDNFAPALLVTKGGPHYATLFLPLKIYIRRLPELPLRLWRGDDLGAVRRHGGDRVVAIPDHAPLERGRV